VVAWPTITRLAGSQTAAGPAQAGLGL
jgi:hypothetical protein